MNELLDRIAFREGVFARDGDCCVMCGAPAQDAHHIMERRLFPDGGYYLDNGATLCGDHHIAAEQTVLTCDEIRLSAGINRVVLPPHLYHDQPYDKWGNPLLPNGTRVRGELFEDESVQKILRSGGVLSLFTHYVKYPRTYHLPFSPGVGKDDRVMVDLSMLAGSDVVITEKMDGENTTLYRDYIHARSLDYTSHESRNRAKAEWAARAHDIPELWRTCCENVYAKHSIHYTDLPGWLLMFSIWNERNICLSWDETVEWAELLGLPMVPLLYRGPFHPADAQRLAADVVRRGGEGIVVRSAGEFPYSDFRRAVGKYVRRDHVQTHGNWIRERIVANELAAPHALPH